MEWLVLMLTIDAAALDRAAEALEIAGEHLTSADGRPLTGPQLPRDSYHRHLRILLEQITGETIRPSDQSIPLRTPRETWP